MHTRIQPPTTTMSKNAVCQHTMPKDSDNDEFDSREEAQKAFLRGNIGRDELSEYFDEKEVSNITGAKKMMEDMEEKDTSEILMFDEDLSPQTIAGNSER